MAWPRRPRCHALRRTVEACELTEQCRVARDPIEDLLKLISDLCGLQVQVELRGLRAVAWHRTTVRVSERERAIGVFHRHWIPPVG